MSETLCVGAAEHVRSAATVLDEAGIRTTVVPDGETARRRARRDSVRCVVTALSLPDQSGAELADHLEATPTIVCAANGDEHVAGRVLAGGADGYVPAADVESVLVGQVRAALAEASDEERWRRTDSGASRRETDGTDTAADGGSGTRSDHLESLQALFGSGTAGERPSYALDADDVAAFVGDDSAFEGSDDDTNDARAPDQIRRAQTLEALHWATDDLLGDETSASIADSVSGAAVRVLGVDVAAVFLAQTDVDVFEPVAARGASANDLPPIDRGSSRNDEPGGEDGAGTICGVDANDGTDTNDGTDADDDANADGGTEDAGSDANDEQRSLPDVDVPSLEAFPAASAEWYSIGDRGLLCLGHDGASGLDGWTAKLASLLASTGNAALDRAERGRQLQRTAAIVEAVGDGVVAVDDGNRITDVDGTFASVTGYSRDRLVGEQLSAVVGEGASARLESCLRELRSAGTPNRRSLAVDLQTDASDPLRCELTLTAVPAAEADSRVVGIVRDVSQRRRLEARLESCEETIRAVHATAIQLESARDTEAVFEATVEGANRALDGDHCRIVECEPSEFSVRAACGAADADGASPNTNGHDGLVAQALEDGQSRVRDRFDAPADDAGSPVGTRVVDSSATDEYHVGTRRSEDEDGRYRSGLAVPIDGSTALEVLARQPAAFGDLDRELAEVLVAHVASTIERLGHEDDLRRQRDRIAALFENVPNPVVRTRIENDLAIVEAVNPSFERVFGYDTDEIVGEVLDEHIVPPDRLARAKDLTRRGLEGEIVETEVHRLTASGTRDFLLTVVPIADGDGNGVNYAIYTDITERKQRQQRLEVLNRVLRHDLRNGMNVVKGSAELLGEHVDGGAADHVEAIDRRAAEMIDLADKTRTVQRTLQSDPGDVGPVDVVNAVEQALDDLDVDVPGTEIETSLPAQAPARVGKLLPVAVRHVLENAIVHHDGEPAVEVTVREVDDDHTVQVVVADDGPGIPEAERMLVTEQRQITQLRHGSGLGLWIVNWVVTGAGGSLEIDDNDPRGTVVRMELPQAPADRSNLPVLLD